MQRKTTDRAAKRLRSFKYIPPPFEVPAPDDFSHQQAGAHFFPKKHSAARLVSQYGIHSLNLRVFQHIIRICLKIVVRILKRK